MASGSLGVALPLTVAVFGDKKVGKTSLIRRFIGQSFTRQHNPTVEDYYEEEIVRGTHRFRQLHILDTTGSYDFPAMRQIAIAKAEAFILVYSLDDPKSFEKVKWHRQEILKYKGNNKVPILIVCNKTDLADTASLEAVVKNSSISTDPFIAQLRAQKKIVDDWQNKLMLTSAKVRWNVNKVFYELVKIEEEQNNNRLINKNTTAHQRRRSSIWFQIVCPASRSVQRPKHLVRTRSLSA